MNSSRCNASVRKLLLRRKETRFVPSFVRDSNPMNRRVSQSQSTVLERSLIIAKSRTVLARRCIEREEREIVYWDLVAATSDSFEELRRLRSGETCARIARYGGRAESKTRPRSRTVEFRTAELSYANFGQLRFSFSDETEKLGALDSIVKTFPFRNLRILGYLIARWKK